MAIYYDDPVCACGPLCETSANIQTKELDTQTNTRGAAIQDNNAPDNFFRLPREIRDKIYFLTSRPDCGFSFGRNEGCEKKHVHQSGQGRAASWRWLVLCRQTWFEAVHYLPMVSNNVVLLVKDDNCTRCWQDPIRCLREGMLHASMKKRDEIKEIELARVRILTIELEAASLYIERDYSRFWDRLAHNLRSLTASLCKVKNLEQITVAVPSEIKSRMSAGSITADAVKQLLSALSTRPCGRPVRVNLKVHAPWKWRFWLPDPGPPPVTYDGESIFGSMIQQMNSTGLDTRNITILPMIEESSLFDSFGNLLPSTIAMDEQQILPSTLWRAHIFDEDFDTEFVDDLWEIPCMNLLCFRIIVEGPNTMTPMAAS